MPISVPPYMPIAQQQRPNIDIAGSIGGLGDALIGGLEYGQKRKIDRATREAFANGIPTGPDGSPDYNAMAARLLQAGNIDAGLGMTRLAETQLQNEFLRGRPQYMHGPGGAIFEEPTQAGQTPREVVPGRPPEPERPIVFGDELLAPDTLEPVRTKKPKPPKPLSVYELKVIKESEDRANAGENTISMLEEALLLSPKALSGIGAQQRGYAGSNLPEGAPGRDASVATEKLNNLVTRQALEQLRTIFAANPTEGERAILLEIQGSVNQAADVREDIYKRAIKLAQKRVAEDRTTAQAIRNREYFSGDDGGAVPGATENAAPAEVSPDNPTSPEPEGEIIESGGIRYMLMPDGTVVQLD